MDSTIITFTNSSNEQSKFTWWLVGVLRSSISASLSSFLVHVYSSSRLDSIQLTMKSLSN